MQPYGQGQLIGSSIDPRLFQQDFSGFTRAAETQAQGMSNLGNQIGQSISQLSVDFDKRKKEQTEQEKEIKRAESIGKMISTSMPEYSEIVTPLIEQMNDKNIPLNERFALANSISDTLKIGVEFKKISMDQAEADSMDIFRRGQIGQAEARAKTAASERIQDQLYKERKDAQIVYEPSKVIAAGRELDVFIDKKKAMYYDPKTRRPIADIDKYASGATESEWGFPNSTPANIDTTPVLSEEAQGIANAYGQSEGLPTGDGSTDSTVLPILQGEVPPEPAPVAAAPAPALAAGLTPRGIAVGAISPKDQQAMKLAQEKADAEKSEAMAKKVSTVEQSQQMISALEKLENHPGFSALFGAYIPGTRLPGTAGASAEAVFKEIEGKGFLEAIKSMKGLGALSDAEGLKASSAFLGLATQMQETEAKARIQELKTIVKNGIDRAKSGKLVNPDGTPLVIDAKSETTDSNATTAGRELLNLPPIK